MRLAFGTDWPVAPLDPLLTLYAATTRATLDGKYNQGWFPEQKVSIQEAIAAYTSGSAYAEFQEHEKGSIEPGKLADLVFLSQECSRSPRPQSATPMYSRPGWAASRSTTPPSATNSTNRPDLPRAIATALRETAA